MLTHVVQHTKKVLIAPAGRRSALNRRPVSGRIAVSRWVVGSIFCCLFCSILELKQAFCALGPHRDPAPTAIIATPTAPAGGAVREASRPRVRLRSRCWRQWLVARSFDLPPAVCSMRAQRRRRPGGCPQRCRCQTPASRPHAAGAERVCAHTRRGDNKQESNGRCSRAPEEHQSVNAHARGAAA